MGETVLQKLRLQKLKDVRLIMLPLIVLNLSLVAVASSAATVAATHPASSPGEVVVAAALVAAGALVRVIWLVGVGFAQAATAAVMIVKEKHKQAAVSAESGENAAAGKVIEVDRRRCYRRWLWWSRVGILVSSLQIAGAAFLISTMVKNSNKIPSAWHMGKRLQRVLTLLPGASCLAVLAQWCTGSDVMAWRSLYQTRGEAWRAHYRELFDYCIRELLCCLGRSRYIAPAQEDEVDAVAALLGDLVAYRAVGRSHLEVLAGVSLLRSPPQSLPKDEKEKSAPEALLREASILHPYAVAAYTGPLLEIGRHPLTWPFAWLYSQGVFSFWNRSRRPALEGDNMWRGHAAAFLRHARLPPDALRKGRVLQTNRESVYFVVVLHELRTVLVAVRGTETPEDLLTDGLGKESPLSESDLLGLLKGPGVPDMVRRKVKESMPHHAHDGIIKAARELSMQLDNLAEDDNDAMAATDLASIDSHEGGEAPAKHTRRGLLSQLLGPKGECEGYHLRFVGHSLGGAISALTGLRLYRRFPDLHVYAFGVLPCVDLVTAQACEKFITSVVYNDEFSSRLSVASLMRLRTDALYALVVDTEAAHLGTPGAKGAPRRLPGSRQPSDYYSPDQSSASLIYSSSGTREGVPLAPQTLRRPPAEPRQRRRRLWYMLKGGAFLCAHTCFCMLKMSRHYRATAIGSEIERAVRALTKQQNGDAHPVRQWEGEGGPRGTEDGRVTVTLVAPVPLTLAGDDAVTEGAKSADDDDDDDEEKFWSAVSIQMPAVVDGDENSDGSTGRQYAQGPVDSELRPNGMPKDIGPGYMGYKTGSDLQELWPVEMFVPGLIIHLVRKENPPADPAPPTGPTPPTAPPPPTGPAAPPGPAPKSWRSSFWYTWRAEGSTTEYHALVADRNTFRSLVISPAMFIDHMPWKCQHALNSVVKQLNSVQSFTALDIV